MTERPRVWSPKALAGVSFLLSAAPAIVMLAINYKRYGEPRKAWIALIAGFTLCARSSA